MYRIKTLVIKKHFIEKKWKIIAMTVACGGGVFKEMGINGNN